MQLASLMGCEVMKYLLRCLFTGEKLVDDYSLSNHDGGLLRAEYANTNLSIKNENEGLWKYEDWLPVKSSSDQIAGTITYKSEKLSQHLGLGNLWVAYHGYWPERGGLCPTTSFKDLEAVCTLQRLQDHACKGMICASAGNTARSFTHFSSEVGFPMLVIVAEEHLSRVWVPENFSLGNITLIGIGDGAGYNDAIDVANQVAPKIGWQLEGGARNIARRDGIGSLIIDATKTMGRLPNHYFQAVGGGPGPIGVHEMACRLVDSGDFEGGVPKQNLSQNVEHCPIHNAWQAKRNELKSIDFPDTELPVFSDYLVNNTPAYSITGGVYDILSESNGQTWSVTFDEAEEASKIFEELEGIDIMSPGAVALASLKKAISAGEVGSSDFVLLNITGGGTKRLFNDVRTRIVPPAIIVSKENAVEAIVDYMTNLGN